MLGWTVSRQREIRAIVHRTALLAGLFLVVGCAAQQGQVDTGAVFYPPLPQLPRLQFLTTINSEEDIGAGGSKFRRFLLGVEESKRTLARAFDVAHENGKLYVVDTRYQAVVIIDLVQKKFEALFDPKGGPLRYPLGIFVTLDGYKYVADRDRGQIVVYNERNEFFRAYGEEKQFLPIDVAVDGDRIYVCDVGKSKVNILDRETGETIGTIGEPGSDDGQFIRPTHLALDSEGNLYVTDFLNFRVQMFDQAGRFVRQIGEQGTFPGAMPRPKGIAVDNEGYLYAADAAFELVQIFDTRTAEVLLGFGKFGPESGGSWLPAGVHIDYDNLQHFARYVDPNFKPKYLVYVANQAGPRMINVYAFGDWVGPTPEGAKTAKGAGS